ncbi:DUF4190 domain-containing protein [Streptomyces sp. NPDC047014]|uniref:DUF4190 domain-containing protein n=1 Tax=Streptomyces sp. NPDC047014 TaxID=3155736 RepID=UPI0033F94B0D
MSTPPSPPPGGGHSWPPPSAHPPQGGWGPQPGWGAPGAGAQPPPLNGFALASLLVGLLCFPPLGIVFGIVALVQISRKRETGRALAIVGLVVSVATTGVLVVTADRAVSAVAREFQDLGELPELEVAGDLTDLDDLRAGDCFNVPGGELFDQRPLTYKVDCSEVHHGEVTASRPAVAPGSPTGEGDRAAEDACWKAQDEYAMDTWALPEYAEMFYYAPDDESWRAGDRTLLCVIGTAEEEWSGSLRQDAGMLKPEQAAFLRAANGVEFVMSRPPDKEVRDALAAYQAWAREVNAALGEEARVLQERAAGAEPGKAVDAQLKAVEVARTEWQAAARARTAAEFDRQWDRALAALPVGTEKAVREAYGLSTQVPPWLEEPGTDAPAPSHKQPGREAASASV